MRRQPYMSYLLRLWRDSTNAPAWRASLENPSTVERQVFSDLESLFIFLQDRCSSASSMPADGEAGEDDNST